MTRSLCSLIIAVAYCVVSADSFGADSAPLIHDVVHQAGEKAELSLLYKGDTAAECRAWQKKFRQVLVDRLGDSSPPPDWTVVQQSRLELDDHVRLELLLEAPGVPTLPVYLLLPTGAEKAENLPAVLCVHGHGQFGNDAIVGRRDQEGAAENIERLNYDYGLQFVRRGYVVVAPCMIPFGRRVQRDQYRGNDPCGSIFVRLQAVGKLPMAENLRDLRWCLSFLQSREEVDPERLGCAGLSYGGRMTMMVSAIDDRVKVASVSGAMNLLQERVMTQHHTCGSQIIPGILQFGDYSEIGSLIAPRPCVWEVGSRDPLLDPEWQQLFARRLRKAYASLSASEQLQVDHFEGAHQWSGRIAFPLFDQVLKN